MLTQTRTSDVKLFRACPKAWHFRQVQGVRTKPRAVLDRGTLAHADVERWLTIGQAPGTPAGRLFVQNLSEYGLQAGMASSLGVRVLVEWGWSLPLRVFDDDLHEHVVTYTGQADLVVLQDGQPPILIDHKSTSSMDGTAFADARALSPEQLAEDLQLNVYSHAIRKLLADKDEVVVMHDYGETGKDGRGRLVGAVTTRKAGEQIWDGVRLTVAEMVEMERRDVELVPGDHTGTHCRAFGGCPFQARCPQWARMQQIKSREISTMSLLSRVGNQSSQPQSASSPSAPQASAAAPVAAEASSPATAAPQAHQPGAAVAEGEPAGFELYVDCVPVPRPGELLQLLHLGDHLVPLIAEVERREKVSHYAQVPYGQGKFMVAALLKVNLPVGPVLVDTRAPLTDACLEVLLPLAQRVVMGVR